MKKAKTKIYSSTFNNSLTDDRGQTQFCQETAELPERKFKRQIFDHYLKRISKITQQYGIYTIEIKSPSKFQGRYQTEDVDIEFSKSFTEYIKNIQHQNSQRANSLFNNNVFSIMYSDLSILGKTESQGNSPVQTSRYTAVRHEIAIFSEFSNTIRENLTSNEVSQKVNHDLQKT